MPWLGIIVATLYALEYESRIPTDRPPARSRRLPTPRYSNHVAIQGSITKLSGTTRPRRRRRRPRRAFSPFRLRPTNGSRRAIERAPPPLHLHSAPVREKGVSSSSSSSSYRSHFLISKRSVFVDERIPLKSNPVARGERDTISWRMAVSTFPRIAAREEELDRRTHRCRSDLRRDFRIFFPDSREFQHLYPVKTGTEEKGGEGRGEKIGGRDAWIRTRTHRGTRTS